jgi:hypothetical protein
MFGVRKFINELWTVGEEGFIFLHSENSWVPVRVNEIQYDEPPLRRMYFQTDDRLLSGATNYRAFRKCKPSS